MGSAKGDILFRFERSTDTSDGTLDVVMVLGVLLADSASRPVLAKGSRVEALILLSESLLRRPPLLDSPRLLLGTSIEFSDGRHKDFTASSTNPVDGQGLAVMLNLT